MIGLPSSSALPPLAALLIALSACHAAQGTVTQQQFDPAHEPEQSAVDAAAREHDLLVAQTHWTVTPLARYRIAARVLHRERYYLGWQSDLSPIDLALGWGPMANKQVDRFIDWYQSGRWYFYHWSAESPYRNEDIQVASANVHLVPATLNVRRALFEIAADDVVWLGGYLISAHSIDDAHTRDWSSSLSRSDVGNGSCELMWVERVVRRGVEYQ
jgi:hypothetical protein